MVRPLAAESHERRSRLPSAEGFRISAGWSRSFGENALRRLEDLSSRLVTAPVRLCSPSGCCMREGKPPAALDHQST